MSTGQSTAYLAEGWSPVLLDTITYRISGHSPSDASSYRTGEEISHWAAADAIAADKARLVGAGIAGAGALDALAAEVREATFEMFALAADLSASPRLDVGSELGRGHVLGPPRGALRRPGARSRPRPGQQPPGGPDRGQGAHRHPRRQGGAQDEGVQHGRPCRLASWPCRWSSASRWGPSTVPSTPSSIMWTSTSRRDTWPWWPPRPT